MKMEKVIKEKMMKMMMAMVITGMPTIWSKAWFIAIDTEYIPTPLLHIRVRLISPPDIWLTILTPYCTISHKL